MTKTQTKQQKISKRKLAQFMLRSAASVVESATDTVSLNAAWAQFKGALSMAEFCKLITTQERDEINASTHAAMNERWNRITSR